MAEPVTRGLTTEELSLVAAGLDGLGRADAALLAVEVRNAAAVAVVQKPAPDRSPTRLVDEALRVKFAGREVEGWSAAWDPELPPVPTSSVYVAFADGGTAQVTLAGLGVM